MYEKLSGMTGTAITEEGEFIEIYKLPVKSIPTNVQITRIDHDDLIYMTKNEKYNAIINEIEYWHKQNKPVLVGTVTVESSEILSKLLSRRQITHKVLNAKYHEKEAEIITLAGQPGSVTIATNMAGRGTDIKLGEGVIENEKETYQSLKKIVNDEFKYGNPLDGLHIVGTERHESRRIDRQLRGRAGRQGDPGTSRFYLSLEDDLMRLFGTDRVAPIMVKLGLKPGDVIRHSMISSAVERAQKRVEHQNFEIRKQLIKYDEVMNQQREVIYTYRRNVLKGYDIKNDIIEMIHSMVSFLTEEYIGEIKYSEEWPVDRLFNHIELALNVKIPLEEFNFDRIDKDVLKSTINEILLDCYSQRETMLGEEVLREIERRSLLEVVDNEWRDHLHEMDILKEGINFRAYAQKDPLIEYKKESFLLFESLINRIHERTVQRAFTRIVITQQNIESILKNTSFKHDDQLSALKQAAQRAGITINTNRDNQPENTEKLQPITREIKVGANEPCPCGSGKKYKKCCGAVGN
jgi:preprotein translocase subunit SecA